MVRTRLAVNRAAFPLLLIAIAIAGSGCRGSTRQERPGSAPGRVVPLANPAATIPVVIEVSGTEGTRFGGAYGEFGGQQSMEGAVPARLTFKTAAGFSVTLQKRGREGELGMTVIVDGKQVSSSRTIKPFGVVTYTYRVAPK